MLSGAYPGPGRATADGLGTLLSSDKDGEAYAEALVAQHGIDGACSRAHAYGCDSADAKRCDWLAAHGDERVLRARAALQVLRSVRNVKCAAMGL